jgi:hypothetical protein
VVYIITLIEVSSIFYNMQIDGNAMELRLQGIINDIITELGGGGEIQNIGWTFADTVNTQDKTKRQVSGIFTGDIKKTFNTPPITDPCSNIAIPLKFIVSVSCTTDDLVPPVIL